MISRILHNFWIKLLAVLMAFLLWFHVATEKEYEVNLRYQLVYEYLPDTLIIASPAPEETVVRCRGSGKNLLPLLFKDRTWRINLLTTAEGLAEIELAVRNVPHYGVDDIEFLAVLQRTRLSFEVERRGRITVPIIPTVVYQPRDGYLRVGKEMVRPDSVTITGPASYLTGISRLRTRSEIFSDLAGPVDTDVELELIPGYNVSLNFARCRLYADVQPYDERSFSNVPIFADPRRDSDALLFNPDTVSVLVGGGRQALGILDHTRIWVSLDTTIMDSVPFLLGLSVRVPAGFRSVGVEPDSVLAWYR